MPLPLHCLTTQKEKTRLLSALLFCALFFPAYLLAQATYHTQNTTLTISGTSTLHDWTERSDKATGAGTFAISTNKIAHVSALTFTVPVKSLKSEHTAMDNNTYKALKAERHPTITYVLTSATVTPNNNNTFTIHSVGKLTIAGTTRDTDVVGTAKLNADKSISVSGTKKIKMTDYSVTPPTVMLGSIKTGNDLTIAYNLKFIQ